MPESGVPWVDVHEGDDSSELPLVAPPAVEVGAGPLHGAGVLVGACRGGNSLESYVGKFEFGGKCRRRRLQKGKIEKNRNEPKDVKFWEKMEQLNCFCGECKNWVKNG